jgi:hypothetical protein
MRNFFFLAGMQDKRKRSSGLSRVCDKRSALESLLSRLANVWPPGVTEAKDESLAGKTDNGQGTRRLRGKGKGGRILEDLL